MYLFSPPGRLERRGKHPLFGRLALTVGLSLLKYSGLYRQVQGPTAEEIDLADITYLGGYTYLITNAEAAELQNAGYGEYLDAGEEEVDTPYGEGAYGTGRYGGIEQIIDPPDPPDESIYGLGSYGTGLYG